jgi:hypothetical protein
MQSFLFLPVGIDAVFPANRLSDLPQFARQISEFAAASPTETN